MTVLTRSALSLLCCCADKGAPDPRALRPPLAYSDQFKAAAQADVECSPIGHVESPYRENVAGGDASDGAIVLTIDGAPQMLRDLDGFSHMWVIAHLHLNKGWKLALSCVRILTVDAAAGRVEVRGLDLIDGTPVLDIKPYLPYCDAFPDAASGWVDELCDDDHSAAADRLDYWPPPAHLLPRAAAASTSGAASAPATAPASSAPAATPAGGVAAHGAALRERGFTVVTSPVLDAPRIDRLARACSARLGSLLDAAADAGYDPLEQAYQFKEVCHRQRARWDLQPPDEMADGAWAELSAAVLAVAAPIVSAALGAAAAAADAHPRADSDADADGEAEADGAAARAAPRVDVSGAVVSRAGCAAQRFHADADEARDPAFRLFTAFVPLVDVAPGGDGTQFWVGSHQGAGRAAAQAALTSDGRLRDDASAAAHLEAPACPRGGVILFDYRTLHRGLASLGRERPVAYLVLATGGAFDGANFAQLSVHEPMAARYVDETPTWEEIAVTPKRARRLIGSARVK